MSGYRLKLLFPIFNTAVRRYTINCKNYNNLVAVVCPIPQISFANFSSKSKDVVTFEEVKCATQDKSVLLIDVREPSELKETGAIPGSINIPLGDVENVLQGMTPEAFKKVYCKEKPQKDFLIIFSCKLGKRSEQAQNIAQKLGYTNVKNYLGGWLEWEEKIKC